MTNLVIVQEALDKVVDLFTRYPEANSLSSIIDQLKYLHDVETGDESRDKISKLNFNVLAARNVEDMDRDVADILYKVFDIYRDSQ